MIFLQYYRKSARGYSRPPLAITQNSDYHGRAQQNDKQHLLSTLELLAMKQEKNYKGGEVEKGKIGIIPSLLFVAFLHFIFLIKLIYLSHAKSILWGQFFTANYLIKLSSPKIN